MILENAHAQTCPVRCTRKDFILMHVAIAPGNSSVVINLHITKIQERTMNNFLHIEQAAGWLDRVETILLVEDEAFVRNVTREILQAAGYRVLTAGDAVAAMRLYNEFGPQVDLLLTDMILPGENGGELTARIRRQKPALRVLFVTGYADQIAVLKDSGEECLAKPFCTEVLLRTVTELMENVQPEQAEPVMLACAGA